MYKVIQDVHIAGIAACVPKTVQQIEKSKYSSLEERKKFIKTTGIKSRRLSNVKQCTSDFCFEAAEVLLKELKWNKDEIEFLVFVTQTPDYILPSTAIILQDRLGLSKNCGAFDINLGCSGYPYGLGILASLLQGRENSKGLLLVGDTSTKGVLPSYEKLTPPLFGDCGTATAIEISKEKGSPLIVDFFSDGSGAEVIMHQHGMYRNPYKPGTFRMEINKLGNIEIDTGFKLDGLEVFNFSVREVPKTINDILKKSGISKEEIDFFVLHQANKLMNEIIRKSVGIPVEKYPYTLEHYGNTSVATIPLTIVDQLKNKKANGKKLLLCGFGVGLSWGTAICDFKSCILPEVIEI